MPSEEPAVVVAGQEARLLAVRPARHGEPGSLRLGAGLVLVLVTEREGDAGEPLRIERGQHVALVLRRVYAAREQQPAVAFHDPRVVAGRQPLGAGSPREGEELGEAEATVAPGAGVRRLAARVPAHERCDHCAPELLAQVERHVWDAEPVTRLARRDHALGGAAGALGVRAVGVEPEPQRHPDRVWQRPQQRDRAVHAAAHRHGDSARRRRGPEHRPERVRERVHSERLSADGRRLEQGQPCDVALETGRVPLDDPVAVDAQPDCGPLAVAARVSEAFRH